jgi:hypothetical protein
MVLNQNLDRSEYFGYIQEIYNYFLQNNNFYDGENEEYYNDNINTKYFHLYLYLVN